MAAAETAGGRDAGYGTTAEAAVGAAAGRSRRQSGRGTLYRGREGMWSWVAHRISGVLVFFFLFVHVLDTSLITVSPNAYNSALNLYKNPFINVMEVGLVGAVLFHAFNGIRVILIDFWTQGPRYQRQMLWVVGVLWVGIMVPAAFFMLERSVLQLFGST